MTTISWLQSNCISLGCLCVSLCNEFSIAEHWSKRFDEAAFQNWAEDLRSRLRKSEASLGLVFMSPRFFPHAEKVLEILRVHARLPVLAGCSSQGLIFGAEELEENPGDRKSTRLNSSHG